MLDCPVSCHYLYSFSYLSKDIHGMYIRFLPHPILFCRVRGIEKVKQLSHFAVEGVLRCLKNQIQVYQKGDAYPKPFVFSCFHHLSLGESPHLPHRELKAPVSQGCCRAWMQVVDNMEKTSKRPVQLLFKTAPWQLWSFYSYSRKAEHWRTIDAPSFHQHYLGVHWHISCIFESFMSSNLLSFLHNPKVSPSSEQSSESMKYSCPCDVAPLIPTWAM